MMTKAGNRIHRYTRALGLFLMLCLVAACTRDDDQVASVDSTVRVDTINVDVVLPVAIQEQWRLSINWALANLKKAQAPLDRRIHLNLRYHDEDKEDLDALGYRLTHPTKGDTCHAIIGPYHSSNAQKLLNHAAATRLPVVMPTCSSAELQRINARNTYAWFLTESDITQCEIMLSSVQAINIRDVALIYSDDTYGRSFKDWFSFYATEHGLNTPGQVLTTYTKGQDLTAFLNSIYDEREGQDIMLFAALSDVNDYIDVYQDIDQFLINKYKHEEDHGEGPPVITLYATDTSYDRGLVNKLGGKSLMVGITPYGSMNFGFPQAYLSTFQHHPMNGDAQVYDALTIIAMGAYHQMMSPGVCYVDDLPVSYDRAPFEPTLTDYMRAIVSSEHGNTYSWDDASLADAFSDLRSGKPVDISGATGNLYFDAKTYTKALNTTYMIWQIENDDEGTPRVTPAIYLSTGGSSSEASTIALWEQKKRWMQEFEEYGEEHYLPEMTDNWAVVISPSTTWDNYRHQADAFSMYQLLKAFGYDDDHIVLIVEDNLADDPRNLFPGKLYVERPSDDNDKNYDMREDAVVDYRFSQLTPDDLADIMLGRQSDRLPHVIHPTASSNVFFFWSGHGGANGGPLWGNEDAKEYFGAERIRRIVSQMSASDTDDGSQDSAPRLYRRMLMAIETCYSGVWGEALTGQPDLLVITAANARETSKADNYDQELGVYLSNAFTCTFRDQVNISKMLDEQLSIYKLYRELAHTTNGSHVTLYNQENYGSVYSNTITEFFPE